MIRTLRITSIIAAILATALFVLPAVYGVRSDPQIEEFLQTPGAVDKFAAARGQSAGAGRDESQASPLVKQAADYDRYLNPPPPTAPTPPPSADVAPEQPAPSAPVSVKFDLVGTSYYASHPELSLALIDEPGKGLHWVRQGSSIAHLTIEKVGDGSITVRDGQRTSEMAVNKVDERWRSLVKGAAPEAKPTATAGAGVPPMKSAAPPALRSGPAGGGAAAKGETGRPPPVPGRGRPVIRNTAAAEGGGPKDAPDKTGAKIPAAKPATSSSTVSSPGEPGEEKAAMDAPPHTSTEKELVDQRVMEDLVASKISPEEAMRMMQMAGTLEQLDELRKQKSHDKTGDTSSPEPNAPPDSN